MDAVDLVALDAGHEAGHPEGEEGEEEEEEEEEVGEEEMEEEEEEEEEWEGTSDYYVRVVSLKGLTGLYCMVRCCCFWCKLNHYYN